MGDEVTVGCNRLAHVRRERPTAITAAKRQQFLDVVAATANVKRAAAAVGVPPQSFYRLRHRDAGFAAAWDQSLDDGYAALEAMLLERALGTAGQAPGDADRAGPLGAFDPVLAMTMLKRRDERSKAPSNYAKASGYKHVPMAEVERSLLRKLQALRRRLLAAGVETPELPS